MEMKDLVTYISKLLVDQPDLVNFTEIEGEITSIIELSVAKEDIGKIIGKQGKTATAIRTIMNAASSKIKRRSVLKIID